MADQHASRTIADGLLRHITRRHLFANAGVSLG